MARLSLFLLGTPKIQLDHADVSVGRTKSMALLAYLAVTKHPSTRAALAALLWPDYETKQAFTYLRQALWTLNKALGKEWLSADPSSVALNFEAENMGAEIWVDVEEFRQHIRLADLNTSTAERLAGWRQAVELYKGDFLAGFGVEESAEFEQWQLLEAQALRHLQRATLANIVEQLTIQHDFGQATEYGRRWLNLDPLDDEAHSQLMRLYSWSGQRGAALRQYQEYAQIVRSELDAPPTALVTQLYEAIVQEKLPLPAAPVSRAVVADTGAVAQAVVIAQQEAPSAADAKSVASYSLPKAITPFIGREVELVQIGSRLRDPECRLLTLVGPGGIGKTRLAVAAAEAHAEHFGDGVAFVALADVAASEQLATTIANALQFTLYRRQEEPQQQLLTYLADKQLLLVMDNFEHLLAEAPLMTEILRRAPQVKVLVTSRERLNVQGEWLLDVPGLGFPRAAQMGQADAHVVTDYSAAELFVRSAQRVDPHFALDAQNQTAIFQICRLVEGMPLALELAAAWLRLISCAEIATEIQRSIEILSVTQRDLPERHRSMVALFDYSWALLSDTERAVMRRLSVFRGGFRREAAQDAAAATLPVLLTLADKSLLRRDEPGRFSMHELLRQFAAEKLTSRPEDEAAMNSAHARYFITFLQRQGAALHGKQQKQVLGQILADIDNLRAAWRHAVEQGQQEAVEAGLDTLATVYELCGWFHEGEAVFAETLARGQSAAWEPTGRLEGKLMARLGFFSHRLGQYDRAKALLRKSHERLLAANASAETIFVLNNLAEIVRIEGDYVETQRCLDESVALCRQHGVRLLLARALNLLGILRGVRGEYDAAQQAFSESLAIAQADEDQLGIAKAYNNLGILAYFAEDFEAARNYYQGSLTINQDLGHQYDAALALSNLGLVAQKQNAHGDAVELFQESLALQRKIGYELGVGLTLNNLSTVLLELDQLAEAEANLREVLQLAQKIQSAPLSLAGVLGMAELYARRDQWPDAARLAAIVQQHPACEEDVRINAEELMRRAQEQNMEAPIATDIVPIEASIEEALSQVVAALLNIQSF
ncbi:MAG: tetratricopeptide repeat protein [Caldilineaceae bacterium]|nr:tetratricopeptide repeat protein [Caldilineaceae bacterium]